MTSSHLVRGTLIAMVVLGGVATASAAPIRYHAVLSGANEVPVTASPGTGTATVIYDPFAQTLQIDIFFNGLVANTTASHIHCCTAPGSNAGVASAFFAGFPFGVTSGSYSQLFDLTDASSLNAGFITNAGSVAAAELTLANALAAGQAYVNVHTTTFPGGEIRGNLSEVPEPGTFALSAMALAGLALLRRRLQ